LAHAGGLSGCNSCQAFVLGLLARLASFRFVSQTLVMKKYLFSCGPRKVFTAIYTFDFSIFVFYFWTGQNLGGWFHL
jgi:hypothetical protein